MNRHPIIIRCRDDREGSAVVSVLVVLVLLGIVLVGLLQGARLERKSSSSLSRENESRFAAESAAAAAIARLWLCTSNAPAFVVGLSPRGASHEEVAPCWSWPPPT